MAKAKESSPQDAVLIFKAAMLRASLSDYIYVNRVMLSRTKTGGSVLIVPEVDLWKVVSEDPEIKPHMRELNTLVPEDAELKPIFRYSEDLDDPSWVEIDAPGFVKGEISQISVPGIDYEVPMGRDLLPIKLRKAETCDIAYRVLTSPKLVILIKKKFKYSKDGLGFSILRGYEVI